jgi:hypothetical protein
MAALWVPRRGTATKKAALADRLFKQRLERVKRFELSTSTLAKVKSMYSIDISTGYIGISNPNTIRRWQSDFLNPLRLWTYSCLAGFANVGVDERQVLARYVHFLGVSVQ